MPTATDKLLQNVLERAEPVIDRLGVLGAPIRDLYDARRAATVGCAIGEVERFLADPDHAAAIFGMPATPGAAPRDDGGTTRGELRWRFGRRGGAAATLHAGPRETTEVLLEVHLEQVVATGKPRYADSAGVIAARSVHRAKSLIETGEAPSLAHNPAARPASDPYGA